MAKRGGNKLQGRGITQSAQTRCGRLGKPLQGVWGNTPSIFSMPNVVRKNKKREQRDHHRKSFGGIRDKKGVNPKGMHIIQYLSVKNTNRYSAIDYYE
jgi:hypothetical protein